MRLSSVFPLLLIVIFQPSCLPDVVWMAGKVKGFQAAAAMQHQHHRGQNVHNHDCGRHQRDWRHCTLRCGLLLLRLSGGGGEEREGRRGELEGCSSVHGGSKVYGNGSREEKEAMRLSSRQKATAAKAQLQGRASPLNGGRGRASPSMAQKDKRQTPRSRGNSNLAHEEEEQEEDQSKAKYIPGCFLEDLGPPGGSHSPIVNRAPPASRSRPHMSSDREQMREYESDIAEMAKRVVASLPKDAQPPQVVMLDGRGMEQFQQQQSAGAAAEEEAELPVQNFPLTPEQQQALDWVGQKRSIFLTGSAGTGKSFLLRHIIASLRRMYPQGTVHVTASTGAAAVLIGGTTVHSFAGVGLGAGDGQALLTRVQSNKQCLVRWRRAKALIIDEISMIDCELFTKISFVAQRVRDNPKPFGGLQLILSGDFFQLPPVSDGARKFAFESEIWDDAVRNTIELKRVMRQGDMGFVRILNELRWGNISAGSYRELIKCQNRASSSQGQQLDGVVDTKLHPYNVNVRAENEKHLQRLPGKAETYTAVDRVQAHQVVGRNSELVPVSAGKHHAYSGRLDQLNVEKTVTLKVGAQVMCLKNLDVGAGLVNGARGVVIGFEANATVTDGQMLPKVKFVCGRTQVMGAETWTVYEGDRAVAERKQLPLSLAWAVSVHKCQGMTLDRVEASLSKAFDHGMVYVALSRVKSLAGLKLSGFMPSKVTAHPAVVAFYRKLGCVPPSEDKEGTGLVVDGGERSDRYGGHQVETTLEQLKEEVEERHCGNGDGDGDGDGDGGDGGVEGFQGLTHNMDDQVKRNDNGERECVDARAEGGGERIKDGIEERSRHQTRNGRSNRKDGEERDFDEWLDKYNHAEMGRTPDGIQAPPRGSLNPSPSLPSMATSAGNNCKVRTDGATSKTDFKEEATQLVKTAESGTKQQQLASNDDGQLRPHALEKIGRMSSVEASLAAGSTVEASRELESVASAKSGALAQTGVLAQENLGAGFDHKSKRASSQGPRLPVASMTGHEVVKRSTREWRERFLANSGRHAWTTGSAAGYSSTAGGGERDTSMAGSLRATERAHEEGTTTLDRVRHQALEKKRKREEAALKAASRPRSALGSSEFVAASDLLKRKSPTSFDDEDPILKKRLHNALAGLGQW